MTSPQRGDSIASPAPTSATALGHRDTHPRCFALVPCAGVGARAGAGGPKQYASLGGRALVLWTLEALQRVPELAGTLVVLARDDRQFAALAAEGDAEAAGLAPRLVRGDFDNLKVTWPEDFALAERLLRTRDHPHPHPHPHANSNTKAPG